MRPSGLVSTILGYARVSTAEQDAALQHDALSAPRGVGRCGLTWPAGRGPIGCQRPAKVRAARRMITASTPLNEVASVLGVGRATLYRHLQPPRVSAAVLSETVSGAKGR